MRMKKSPTIHINSSLDHTLNCRLFAVVVDKADTCGYERVSRCCIPIIHNTQFLHGGLHENNYDHHHAGQSHIQPIMSLICISYLNREVHSTYLCCSLCQSVTLTNLNLFNFKRIFEQRIKGNRKSAGPSLQWPLVRTGINSRDVS